MDIRYDRRILRCHVRGTHLHHSDRYCDSDRVFQRGYCYCECPQSSPATTVYKSSELVLAGDNNVLPVRRERYLLFQAHSTGRQSAFTFCDPSSIYQLRTLRYRYLDFRQNHIQGLTNSRVRLLRCVLASGPLSIPIYPIRVDTYGSVPYCGSGALYHEQCL